MTNKFILTTCISAGLLFSSLSSAANEREKLAHIPDRPSSYVSDMAGIIGSNEEKAINDLISELERKTTAEVAVLTLASTKPEDIHNFSMRVFDKWKPGKNMGKPVRCYFDVPVKFQL